jgi:hypothetical protein
MRKKSHYDFYLILATAVVLFAISVICIYGMFYFKLAQVNQLPAAEKMGYMNSMNTVMAPFLIALILLLGICVPKRLLPTAWLNWFSMALIVFALITSFIWGLNAGFILVLIVSLVLQTVVLFMALAGSKELNFEKKGYWVRVGSSLLHLALILFILDIFFYSYQSLHLVLFWITTVSSLLGMVFCFYAESFSRVVKKKITPLSSSEQEQITGDR